MRIMLDVTPVQFTSAFRFNFTTSKMSTIQITALYIYRAVHICTALQEPSSYFILDSYSKVYISVIISYWCILYPCILGYIESLHIGVLFRQAEFPCLPPALTLTAPHIPQYRFLFSFTTFFLRRGKVHRYRFRYIQIPDPTLTKL